MNDNEPDAALAARAARGQDSAFSTLMRRHERALFLFVRRYVGAGDVALDIVQESFVSAWKALGRYDARVPFAVWLRSIALNKCRDHGRRMRVRRILFGEKDLDSVEAQRQADPAVGAHDNLVEVHRRAALEAAIARLPSKLKEPLLLTYFEDLSQLEAAKILGVSVKTVETRVYRARQKLAEAVASYAEN